MRTTIGLMALMLGVVPSLVAQTAGSAVSDSTPAAVVQRFVDAAIARDADAMAALVAPDAVFERFPSGTAVATGRDGIHAMYARMMPTLPADFRITISPRIVEGQIVIDQEHFSAAGTELGQATWIYRVAGGLIQRAWVVDGAASP